MPSHIEELPKTPFNNLGWPWETDEKFIRQEMENGWAWPRITIVTPSFNQGRFLEQTIRSILLQKYPNLEYIIIDGGSQDNSVDIIRKYEPWLAYWVSQPDRGQSDAINKGWARGTGDIFAWLNSDDYYGPGTLVSVAQKFSELGPEVGLINGLVAWVNSSGEITHHTGQQLNLAEILPTARNAVVQPGAFMRADIIRDLNGLATDLHYSMDWDLWNRIAVCRKTKFFPEVWAYINVWEGTKTQALSQSAGFGPEMLKSVCRLYEQPDLPKEILGFKRKALAAIAIRAASGHYRAGHYTEMRRTFWFGFIIHPLYAIKRSGRHSLRYALGWANRHKPLLLA